ncbi:MAG TPA: hypothetical protein VL501_06855 [Pyrinomonadaceae bacterium]|nr:hypothetical protein [Pyrinomonadaceae bacterium]
MPKLCLAFACALAALVGVAEVSAQDTGKKNVRTSLVLKTRVNPGGGKPQLKFPRKRFYLFRGGWDVNKALADRIEAAPYTSRDCFYCTQKASPEYISWLRAADCESPYCREISADDVVKVPEFATAYKKGLVAFKNKPDLARSWVTTNMPGGLRDGYYLQKKKVVDGVLAGTKPEATVMTDSGNLQAIFIDIMLGEKDSQKFLVTNLVPFEVGDKAYLWVCEVDVKASPSIFTLPANSTKTKDQAKICDVIVRELPKCTGGGCSQ